MKVVLLLVLLLIPVAFSTLHGGETATFKFNKCEELTVEVNSTPPVDYGEIELDPECVEIDAGYFECICENNFILNVTPKINAVGSYDIKFTYSYFNDTEEVIESFDSNNYTDTVISTYYNQTTTTSTAPTTTTIAENTTSPVVAETLPEKEQSRREINLIIVLIPVISILITLGVLYAGSKRFKKPSKESTDTLEPQA